MPQTHTIESVIEKLHSYQQKQNSCACKSDVDAAMLYLLCKDLLNIKIQIISGFLYKCEMKNGKLIRKHIVNHCWCEYDGKILEPTYEYCNQSEFQYVKNFCDLDSKYIPIAYNRLHIQMRMALQKAIPIHLRNLAHLFT